MANDVFTKIDTFLNDFLTQITDKVQNTLSSDIGTIINVSVVCYIMFFGYMILAGKVQTPFKDIVWNLTRLALIIAFVKNQGGILDTFEEAVKGISTLGGNGKSVLANFDSMIEPVSQFSVITAKNTSWSAEWLTSSLIWLGFGLMAVPITLTYLLAKIAFFLLLALSPIFFFMLMWGWLKDTFANFASALLSNALSLVCLNIMVNSSIDFIKAQTNADGNPFLVSFSFILFGIVAGISIKYIVTVINTVMRVSVERAGAGIVGAYKSAKNYAQSAFSPTQNDISRANVNASRSQIETQKALQDLANKINNK